MSKRNSPQVQALRLAGAGPWQIALWRALYGDRASITFLALCALVIAAALLLRVTGAIPRHIEHANWSVFNIIFGGSALANLLRLVILNPRLKLVLQRPDEEWYFKRLNPGLRSDWLAAVAMYALLLLALGLLPLFRPDDLVFIAVVCALFVPPTAFYWRYLDRSRWGVLERLNRPGQWPRPGLDPDGAPHAS